MTWNRVEGTVSFSKRGFDLGVAFEGVHEEHMYPIVGFRTPDEEVGALWCLPARLGLVNSLLELYDSAPAFTAALWACLLHSLYCLNWTAATAVRRQPWDR